MTIHSFLSAAGHLFLALLVVCMVFRFVLLLNLGRLFGHVSTYSENCEFNVRGTKYNGLKVQYIFFIPVWRSGFYHSTALI